MNARLCTPSGLQMYESGGREPLHFLQDPKTFGRKPQKERCLTDTFSLGFPASLFAKLPRPHCLLIRFHQKGFMKSWFHKVKRILKAFLCTWSFLPSAFPCFTNPRKRDLESYKRKVTLMHLLSVGYSAQTLNPKPETSA